MGECADGSIGGIMKSKKSEAREHTPTPLQQLLGRMKRKIFLKTGITSDELQELDAEIVEAVNAYSTLKEENEKLKADNAALLDAAKNARNVFAALVTGDLKSIKADSPALTGLRIAITQAESSEAK